MLKGKFSSRRRVTEEVDAMSGLANLSDVMLVFACGLMAAVIQNWNVDLSKTRVEILQRADGIGLGVVGHPPAGADAGAGQRGRDGAGHPVLQQLRAEGHGVRRPGDREAVCGDAEEQ